MKIHKSVILSVLVGGALVNGMAPVSAAENKTASGVVCTADTPYGHSCSGTVTYGRDYMSRVTFMCPHPSQKMVG